MRKVAIDVIAEINKLIQKAPHEDSIKGKRYLLLNTHYNPLTSYSELGLPADKSLITEEDKQQLWLNRILQALVDKGHLFKLDKANDHGYYVQA